MKMKTYQADTMQEALTKVKEEMGPDAVILKSRKSVRKVNGKNQPCFEVTAALEDASPAPAQARVTAGPGQLAGRAPAAPAFPAPADAEERGSKTLANGSDRRAPARAGLPGVPERRLAGRVPDENTYDWKGSLRRVDEAGRAPNGARASEVGNPAEEGRAPAQAPKGAGAMQNDMLEMLRNELREVREKVDMPTREIQVLKKEIKAMIETVAAQKAASAAPAAPALPAPPAAPALPSAPRVAGQGMMDFSSPGALPEDLRPLHGWLTERDFDADLAAELAFAARSATLPDAMAARIRTTGGVRLRPGKPAVIAMVGPTGAGKTTTLCKLAALAKMHQGKKVAILSADSFRMGANEQLELFGRTAGIPVRPLFSAADVAPALKEFAGCDLILVDTAGRSHAHPETWAELQNMLRVLNADEIHLVLSCTTRMRELLHQAGLYGNLGRLAKACGVVFTKLDECVTLGCMYNLIRRLDAPVSYLCDGQVIPDHISLATPQGVAAKVIHAGRAAEEAWRAAQQPAAMAG